MADHRHVFPIDRVIAVQIGIFAITRNSSVFSCFRRFVAFPSSQILQSVHLSDRFTYVQDRISGINTRAIARIYEYLFFFTHIQHLITVQTKSSACLDKPILTIGQNACQHKLPSFIPHGTDILQNRTSVQIIRNRDIKQQVDSLFVIIIHRTAQPSIQYGKVQTDIRLLRRFPFQIPVGR